MDKQIEQEELNKVIWKHKFIIENLYYQLLQAQATEEYEECTEIVDNVDKATAVTIKIIKGLFETEDEYESIGTTLSIINEEIKDSVTKLFNDIQNYQ